MDFTTVFNVIHRILPEAIFGLTVLACYGLLLFAGPVRDRLIGWTAVLGSAVSLVSFLFIPYGDPVRVLLGAIRADDFTACLAGLIIAATLVTLLLSRPFAETAGKDAGEYYALLMTASLGGLLLATADDIVSLYVGFEMLGLACSILAGMSRKDHRSAEAALKYLIIGALSSALLLYGFSFLYGITGHTSFPLIASALVNAGPSWHMVIVLAMTAIIAGLSFKVAAVPFHAWAPDVYEGAPSAVSAYLSVVSKVAGFAAVVRVFAFLFPADGHLQFFLALLAGLSMTFGNIMALTQKNIKRFLAYSSISQTGYLLMAVTVFSPDSVASLIFYLAGYLFTNLAAWAVVIAATSAGEGEGIDDLAGLWRRRPGLALAMTVSLMSLAGLPFTACFFGKFYLFVSVFSASTMGMVLTLVALANTAVAIAYYAMVIRSMFRDREPGDAAPASPVRKSAALTWTLAVSIVLVVAIGVFTSPMINASLKAAISLFNK